MSRRRRKRAAVEKTGKRWLVRLAVAVPVVALLAASGGWLWLRAWLHGEDFRRMLAREAGNAIGAEAEFGAFRWSGTRMETPSFVASGEKLVKSVDARGLDVDLGLGGVWRRTLTVESARAKSIAVEIDAGAADRREDEGEEKPPGEPKAEKRRKWYDGLLPDRVSVEEIDVADSSLTVRTGSGPVSLSGTSWRVLPGQREGSYRAEAEGGTLSLPWENLPPLGLGRARLSYGDDTVFLTEAGFSAWRAARLDLTGEMSTRGDGYTFQGRLTDVGCDEILPGDWKKRLEGRLDADFTVDDADGGPRVRGRIALSDGTLTALPLLDSLSAYANTTRFRRLALQECGTRFEWRDRDLALTGMVISSEGLVRIEGSLLIDRAGRLDGVFRLGLVPGLLAHLPGAETHVFQPGEKGFLWAPLRIGGTLDDPEEDLTPRLIAAAGERMFELLPESGVKVLKFTREVVGDDLAGKVREGAAVIEQGKEVIKEAESVAREVQGIFDVLRGKDRREEDDGEKGR